MSTIQRIVSTEKVQSTVAVPSSSTAAAAEPRRLNLHQLSSFERVSSVAFADGSQVIIPHMSASDAATATAIFAKANPDARLRLEAAVLGLADAIKAEVQGNPGGLKSSVSSGLTGALNQTLEVFMVDSLPVMHGEVVQGIMFGAMAGIEQDVADFAHMVQGNQEAAAELRTDITELREMISDWPEGSTQHFTWHECESMPDGSVRVVEKEGELTKDQAVALMDKLESQKTNITETTEMQKFDLQTMTHNYQQGLQVLSELMKAQHDSLMRIIQNAKAS